MSQSSARLVSLHLTFNDGISSLVWPMRFIRGYGFSIQMILLRISLVTYRRGLGGGCRHIFAGVESKIIGLAFISSIKYSELCSQQGRAAAFKNSFGCFQSVGRWSVVSSQVHGRSTFFAKFETRLTATNMIIIQEKQYHLRAIWRNLL